MTTYAIANSKGGVGKSTIAVQIACEKARQGREVLVINGDRQKSSELAMLNRAQSDDFPPITCVRYEHGPELLAAHRAMKGKYDDIVIDVGGRDSSAMRAALVVCDVALVPFAPGSFEVWALEEMDELLRNGLTATPSRSTPCSTWPRPRCSRLTTPTHSAPWTNTLFISSCRL